MAAIRQQDDDTEVAREILDKHQDTLYKDLDGRIRRQLGIVKLAAVRVKERIMPGDEEGNFF